MGHADDGGGGRMASFLGFVFDCITQFLMWLGMKRLWSWANKQGPRNSVR
jgi:hypothetical protein